MPRTGAFVSYCQKMPKQCLELGPSSVTVRKCLNNASNWDLPQLLSENASTIPRTGTLPATFLLIVYQSFDVTQLLTAPTPKFRKSVRPPISTVPATLTLLRDTFAVDVLWLILLPLPIFAIRARKEASIGLHTCARSRVRTFCINLVVRKSVLSYAMFTNKSTPAVVAMLF